MRIDGLTVEGTFGSVGQDDAPCDGEKPRKASPKRKASRVIAAAPASTWRHSRFDVSYWGSHYDVPFVNYTPWSSTETPLHKNKQATPSGFGLRYSYVFAPPKPAWSLYGSWSSGSTEIESGLGEGGIWEDASPTTFETNTVAFGVGYLISLGQLELHPRAGLHFNDRALEIDMPGNDPDNIEDSESGYELGLTGRLLVAHNVAIHGDFAYATRDPGPSLEIDFAGDWPDESLLEGPFVRYGGGVTILF